MTKVIDPMVAPTVLYATELVNMLLFILCGIVVDTEVFVPKLGGGDAMLFDMGLRTLFMFRLDTKFAAALEVTTPPATEFWFW